MGNEKGVLDKISRITTDGWENVKTGLGRLGKDKRMSAKAYYNLFTEHEAEQLYAADDMARKIVDMPVEEMFREGFELKIPKDNNKVNDIFISMLQEKDLLTKLEEGVKLGRLYGGAITYLGIMDGLEADQPVNEKNIRGIEFATNLNRHEVQTLNVVGDPTDKRYGLPEFYQITPSFGGGAVSKPVHHTRVLRWDGLHLPRRIFINNNYWHDSVLTTLENVLRNFHTAHDSVASTIVDFNQAVFKITGLADIIAAGHDGVLQKRLELVDSMRSIVKAVIIDDEEGFDRKSTTLTGLAETVRTVDNRLVQAANVPHTKLLGEGSTGSLSGAGESEKTDWYDTVKTMQNKYLAPQLETLTKYMLLSKEGPTKGVEPPEWKIVFKPMERSSDKDIVEIREKQANADEKYFNMGALDPDEIRNSRFGGTEYSLETKLMSSSSTLDRPVPKKPEDKDVSPGS